MASTIKVDKIEGSTGSTVTVPTGQTFTVTDGIAIGNLPTITAVKGGTNQTTWAVGDLLYANGVNTLTKLTKPGSTQVLQMTSAGVPSWVTASGGKTIKRYPFAMATRTASSGSSAANVNQFTITAAFTPTDPTANDLWVECLIPTSSDGNDRSGFGLRFDNGSTQYDNFGKGVTFAGGIAGTKMAFQSTSFNIAAGTMAAGTYTITLRTETDSSQALYYNPNSSDNATWATQTQTELMITEWKN